MTITENYKSIAFLDFFAHLEDPRIDRHKLYPLNEVLLTTLYAYICDARSWEDIQEFGETRIDFLKQFLPYKN